MSVYDELAWRGMVFDSTPGCEALLATEKVACYIGFDPSAKSLHMGQLIPIMGLMRMQRHGHTPIAIAGGGTGLIGDPRPTSERQLLGKAQVEENVEGIRAQLARFLDFNVKSNPAKLVNNADWLVELGLIDFLRDTGKQFTVNYMLDKESVKARLGREGGISFTEFSYMLLQAYDYLQLYRGEGCRLQMGGSDQWGNILAGVDLIKRVEAVTGHGGAVTGYSRGEPHALVYPLLTTASGEKFGKSEGNAIWLDRSLTSPFRCYQYWINVDDRDVVTYLKWFTFLDRGEIEGLERAVREEPAKREAQRRLAHEVTLLVHAQDGLEEAERASRVLFGGSIEGLSAAEIEDIFADVPNYTHYYNVLTASDQWLANLRLTTILASAGMVTSASEARRLVQQGGIYVNNRRVGDVHATIRNDDLIEGRLVVLRKGTKDFLLLKFDPATTVIPRQG